MKTYNDIIESANRLADEVAVKKSTIDATEVAVTNMHDEVLVIYDELKGLPSIEDIEEIARIVDGIADIATDAAGAASSSATTASNSATAAAGSATASEASAVRSETAASAVEDFVDDAMLKSIYDPDGILADTFDMGSMKETATAKIMTAAERTKLTGIAAGAQVNAVRSVAGRTGDVVLGAADVAGVVRHDAAQTLTGAQQQQARTNIDAAQAHPPAGGVGSFALANFGGTATYGSVHPGSSLRPVGAIYQLEVAGLSGGPQTSGIGSHLMGSWVCLGESISGNVVPGHIGISYATLFRRIA